MSYNDFWNVSLSEILSRLIFNTYWSTKWNLFFCSATNNDKKYDIIFPKFLSLFLLCFHQCKNKSLCQLKSMNRDLNTGTFQTPVEKNAFLLTSYISFLFEFSQYNLHSSSDLQDYIEGKRIWMFFSPSSFCNHNRRPTFYFNRVSF